MEILFEEAIKYGYILKMNQVLSGGLSGARLRSDAVAIQ
jgi:hypothetical protein